MKPTERFSFAEKVKVFARDVDGDTANKVELHEKVHGADHHRVFDELIVPWDETLEMLKRDSEEQQLASAYRQAGKNAGTLAAEFKAELSRRGREFHNTVHGKEALGELKTWNPTELHIVW